MPAELRIKQVGPWPMNTYLIVCEETGASAIVDPGADADEILENVRGTRIEKILLTHAHGDHVGALEEVKVATGVPVYHILRMLKPFRFLMIFHLQMEM